MKEETTKTSPLERLYDSVNKKSQSHFRDEWMTHFEMTRDAFYKRLKRPIIEDLCLFAYVFDALLLADKIMKSYDFKLVEKYQESEKIENLVNL